MFNCPIWGVGKTECPFNLHSIAWCKLSKYDKGADIPFFVFSIQVVTMCHVSPWHDITEMDLGAFAIFLPFFDPRVTSFLNITGHGMAQVENLDADGL